MNYTDTEKEILKGLGLTDDEITELEKAGVAFADAELKFKAVKDDAEKAANEAVQKAELEATAKAMQDRIINQAIESKAKLDLTRKASLGRITSGSRSSIVDKAINMGISDRDMTAHGQYAKSETGRVYTEDDRAALALFGMQMKASAKGDNLTAKKIDDLVEKTQTWSALNYGGFAMSVEYLPLLIEARDHVGPLRSIARTLPPVTARTGNFILETSIGSVTWGAPSASKTATRVKANRVNYTLAEVNCVIVAEDFLLEMAYVDLGSYLTRSMARALAKSEWAKFVNGTGTNQPTGLETSVWTQTASAGASFDFTDINAGFFALATEYRDNAVWIMRDNNLESIHNLADSQNRPILSEIVTNGNPVPVMKGKRIYINNNLTQNTAATPKNSVFFLDPSYYLIFETGDVSTDATNQATVTDESGSTINLWQENKTAYKLWYYCDMKIADVRAGAELTNVP